MRKDIAICRTLCLMLFVFSALIHAESAINLIAEDYKPLSYLADGELRGPSADIVSAIRKRLGHTRKISVFPWKRAYVTTLAKPNTALFSMTRTEEREALFKWVGPLAEKQFNLYALKTNQVSINQLPDAKNYVIGVENGTINEQFLTARGFRDLSRANTAQQNLKKLLAKRIDLWCVASSTFNEMTTELGISTDNFKQLYTVKKARLYLAFNKNTPDEEIVKWQIAFNELYTAGVVATIFSHYKLDYLYPSID